MQQPSIEETSWKTIGSLQIKELIVPNYHKVIEAIDKDCGLHAIIAVHDLTMGPALGGTRMYPYPNREAALTDVLRLSEGMTYKSAVAEVGFGGGKSVIIGNSKTQKTESLLRAFGKAVDSLEGIYICAEDMGTTPSDMSVIRESTPFVAGLPMQSHSSGDPSRFTAWGVYKGLQSVAYKLWGSTSLEGKSIAIQGVGHVGALLAEHLFWSGAKLIFSDIDESKALALAHYYRGQFVNNDQIYAAEYDIFCPCAIGGILNEKTINQLRCQAVAGAANNQLLTAQDCDRLKDKGIYYAPDFVINSGGVINVACEMSKEGYQPHYALDLTNKIYDHLLTIFDQSEGTGTNTHKTACDLALHKLKHQIGKRDGKPHFHH
ncbi:MAG: Glu/Leu/Phe/Val dehydrogenase [Parachlamydiales bacterium]|nr:Glu/Leu/Phe/Val dehydrogenase [Parachlamydiales bacterium]